MRYYEIEITDPTGSAPPLIFTSWVQNPTFPSSVFGSYSDLGALNVNFDFYIVPYCTPRGASMVEIQGIDLKTISGANNLNGKSIKISAGFKPGLPLATHANSNNKSGPILFGYIFQAYGNWIGTNMTLNLIILPGAPAPSSTTATTAAQTSTTTTARPPTGTVQQPFNGRFEMPAGMFVSQAIRNFLATAMPNFTIQSFQLSRDFSTAYPQGGAFSSLAQFNEWIYNYSRSVVGNNYGGINIRIEQGNKIVVYDIRTSGQATARNIEFLDLIGQPTWMGPNQIQFKCPMRADLQVGYGVTMPVGFYTISPNQPGGIGIITSRSRTAQQGTTVITELRHVGNFRQPDANSWVTVITCSFVPPEQISQ